MKQIELTLENREKLLEMCKVLFLEYGDVQLLKSYCATEFDDTGSPYLRWYLPFTHEGKNTTKLFEIHWFQFLMCELIPKFKKLGINIDYWLMTLPSTHIQWIGTNVNHPIDYVYNEFKKLENGK